MAHRTSWNSRGQPVPSLDDYRRYEESQGRAGHDYDEWRRKVESAKTNNADAAAKRPAKTADRAPVETPTTSVPAPAPAAPAAPVSVDVFATMPHRHRKQRVETEVMNVRVRAGISDRLAIYLAKHRGVKKQDVVSDVLEAFLAHEGL